MSKRLKNYPDPVAVVHKFGADALRLYLINSPVVRAESLRFKEGGVKDVVKDVFLPWFNAYRFLMQNVARLKEVNIHLFKHVHCIPRYGTCTCMMLYYCSSKKIGNFYSRAFPNFWRQMFDIQAVFTLRTCTCICIIMHNDLCRKLKIVFHNSVKGIKYLEVLNV